MANRRMFSIRLVQSARFLKMPLTSQALYFHLGLMADDDGIVEAYSALKLVGCKEDDLRVLISKGYVQIIDNEDMIAYITDWSENNSIRADRKVDSIYKDLLLQVNPDAKLIEKKPRSDVQKKHGRPMDGQWTTNGRPMDGIGKDSIGEGSIGEGSIGKVSIGESEGEDAKASTHAKKPPKQSWGEYQNVKMTKDEVDKLAAEYGEDMTRKAVKFLDEYIEMKGYKARSHYLCIRKWVITAVKEQEAKEHKDRYGNTPISDKARELEAYYKMDAEWAMKGELNEYEADNGYNTGDSFGDTSSYSGYGDN